MAEDTTTEAGSENEPQTEGAIKASKGNHFFKLDEMSSIDAGPNYSTANGPVIEGERIQVGLIHKPAGSGSRLHQHPNEQFNYVVQGTLRVKIEDNDEVEVHEGEVAYIPPETQHYSMAGQDEDCYFYVCKDMTGKIYGQPVDQSNAEAQYDEGFEPEDDE